MGPQRALPPEISSSSVLGPEVRKSISKDEQYREEPRETTYNRAIPRGDGIGTGRVERRRGRPKSVRNPASNTDQQRDSASNTELKTESDVSPDQTPHVRVLLYCFKPSQPRAAAAPPPRRADKVKDWSGNLTA